MVRFFHLQRDFFDNILKLFNPQVSNLKTGNDNIYFINHHENKVIHSKGSTSIVQNLENPRDGGAWWAAVYGVSILAWKIPWAEELGRLQSMASLRVRHD